MAGTAIVTGASRGIGKSIAVALARPGYDPGTSLVVDGGLMLMAAEANA